MKIQKLFFGLSFLVFSNLVESCQNVRTGYYMLLDYGSSEITIHKVNRHGDVDSVRLDGSTDIGKNESYRSYRENGYWSTPFNYRGLSVEKLKELAKQKIEQNKIQFNDKNTPVEIWLNDLVELNEQNQKKSNEANKKADKE